MTVTQMIEALMQYPPDTKVIAYNGDNEDVVDVTGFLYDPSAKTVELCTDDNS